MPPQGADPIFDQRVADAKRRQAASMSAYGSESPPSALGRLFRSPLGAGTADAQYERALQIGDPGPMTQIENHVPGSGRAQLLTEKPLESPAQTVNPFPREPFKMFRMKGTESSMPAIGESAAGASSERVRPSSRDAITPGLRAGAAQIATDIAERPDIGRYASGLLEQEHQGRLGEIAANDPYERARAAEHDAYADNAFLEDTGLYGDSGIESIDGVYRHKGKRARQTGAEQKRSLETQRTAGYGFDRARAAEQEKAATENARRNSYLRAATSGIDAKYAGKAQELQATLKGDQLRAALQQLDDKKREEFNEAVTNAYQIGAKFDLR